MMDVRKQRRYEDAASLLKEAIEIDERTYGKEHPQVGAEYGNLATAMLKLVCVTTRPDKICIILICDRED